jgi:hypothetical protein
MLDKVNANAKEENGQTLYPHMYGRLDRLERLQRGGTLDDLPEKGPEGWYEFRPQKFAPSVDALWYWTLDRSALELAGDPPRWVRFLDGNDPGYPEAALRGELETLRRKMEMMRADHRSPDMTMSDDMNRMNPATTGALTQLMLGGIPTGRDVPVLHARLRYFDPARRRAGLPEHVGALVERMTDDEVTVQLVNLDPVEARTVIVQGGAYAEHQLTRVRSEPIPDARGDADGMVIGRAGTGRRSQAPREEPAPVDVSVDHPHVAVRLGPACGARLIIGMTRYTNRPTFAFPWV